MHTGEEMPFVTEDASMQQVVLVMAARRFGCVGITDNQGALTGIITDGDLSRHMDRDLLDRKPVDVMTRNPKIIAPDRLAAEALAVMNERKITQLFVLNPEDKSRRPKVSCTCTIACAREWAKPDRATANPLKPMRKRRDWAARPRGTMLDAERYTRFVSIMKRALPIVALVLIAAVVVYAVQPRQKDRMAMTFERVNEVANDLAMIKPRLTGSDAKGNPFVVTADRAIQQGRNSRRAKLENVDADMSLDKKSLAQRHRGHRLVRCRCQNTGAQWRNRIVLRQWLRTAHQERLFRPKEGPCSRRTESYRSRSDGHAERRYVRS